MIKYSIIKIIKHEINAHRLALSHGHVRLYIKSRMKSHVNMALNHIYTPIITDSSCLNSFLHEVGHCSNDTKEINNAHFRFHTQLNVESRCVYLDDDILNLVLSSEMGAWEYVLNRGEVDLGNPFDSDLLEALHSYIFLNGQDDLIEHVSHENKVRYLKLITQELKWLSC